MVDQRPICVAAQGDDGTLSLLLTDGRSLVRHASTRRAPADLNEPPRLREALFAGSLGDALFQLPGRSLDLQLPAALDALPWEQVACDDPAVALGQRLRITRHLVAGADTPLQAAEPALLDQRRSVLGWTQFGGSDEAPLGWSDRCRWNHAQPAAALPLDAQVLRWRATAPPAGAPTSGARVAPLWVVDAGALRGAAGQDWLRAVCDGGSAVLVLPQMPAADAPFDLEQPLASLLCEGREIDEAVRLLRASRAEPWLRARLYGYAQTALVTAPPAPPPDERRRISALSFDVVDSTAAIARLGEEAFAQQLLLLLDAVREIVQRRGGMAGDAQGSDGVMNYFGHPIALENAAERAVEAALDVASAGERLRLPVRVGVSTGQVVVHSGLPFGGRVNMAARLQQRTPSGTVLVCPTTHELTQSGFEFERQPDMELKGLPGTVAPWRVQRRVASEVRAPAQHHGFVGRDAELQRLLALAARTRAGPARVALALVEGDPGIGKSRLLREFRLALRDQGHAGVECRCLADGSTTAFHAVVQTLTRMLQLREPLSQPGNLDRIRQALPPTFDAGDELALMAGLLSVPPGDGAPQDSPERVRLRTLDLLVRWLQHTLAQSGGCLLVEDLHWSDPSTAGLLARLVAAAPAAPLLVVVSQRPGRVPPWLQPCDLHLPLQGLAPDVARALVDQVCAERPLAASLVRQIVSRCDGVPLFLEESARSALEVIQTRSSSEAGDVPARLQDLLMLRLDRLGPARRLAQFAAVLGREFPQPLLERVVDESGELPAGPAWALQLRQLELSGLLRAVSDSEGRRLIFKHALIRDTAYQSLWVRDRKRLHALTATVLARDWPALVQRQPELLARHLAEAGRHVEAVGLWEQAARQAAARSAQDEAIAHVQQALALLRGLPAAAGRDRIEQRLLLLLAARLIATEGYGADEVEQAYERAAALASDANDAAAELKITLGLEAFHFMRGAFDRAQAFADRACVLAAAPAVPDPLLPLQVQWALANIEFHQGRLVPALERMDACLAQWQPSLHRSAGVQNPAVMCLCYSAWGLFNHGLPDDALERIRRVLALAQAVDHRFSICEAHAFAASVHAFRGEAATALRHADLCLDLCGSSGFLVWEAHARITRGRLLCDQGLLHEGLAEMADGYRQWCRTGAEVTRPFYLAQRAEGLALAGDTAQALRLVDEARALAERNGEHYHLADLKRLGGELLLEHDPARAAEARDRLLAALQHARSQQAGAFGLRAATALARSWAQAGRHAAARALLAPLLDGMTQGRATRDIQTAHALMRHLDETAHASEREGTR